LSRPSAKKLESLEVQAGQLPIKINRRPQTKKTVVFTRNDKEKGSVSHFPGGYHIGILKA